MGEGFKRFKRLYLIDTIVKALVTCISVSLLIIATFLIVIDKGVIDFQALSATLIGVGSGLLLGLVVFILSFKRDKRLARLLDEKLGLNEKAQTMFAFREDSGGLKEIQRESTRILLDNTKVKLSSLLKVWLVLALVLILAVSYFVVSLVMYSQEKPIDDGGEKPIEDDTSKPEEKPNEQPSEEEKFEPTDHHKKELEQLIKYVSESALDETAKAAVIKELNDLLGMLDTFGTDSAMKEYVTGVIVSVNQAVNQVNNTYAFYQAAKDLGNKTLEKINRAFYYKDLESLESELDTFYNSLIFASENELRPKDDIEAIKDEIDALKNALATALENSGLTSDDPLWILMNELVTVFNTILEKSKSVSNIRSRLDPIINTNIREGFTVEVKNEDGEVISQTYYIGLRQLVPTEKTNEDVRSYTITELSRIFGIDLSELGGTNVGGGEDYGEPDTQLPESNNGGSYGDGSTNFPSNDKVINPDSTEIDIDKIQVEYGEIISKYMTEIKNKIEKGEYSEELALILNEYFKLLTTPKQ